MSQLFTNNASGTLSVQAEIIDTTLTLQVGEGALYPNPTGGDFFMVTLEDVSGNLEICQCTGRATDVLTVVRAQESTSALQFVTGSRVECRFTAGTHDSFLQVYGGVMQGELDLNNENLRDPLILDGEARNLTLRGTDGGVGNQIIVPTAGGAPTLGGNTILHTGNDSAYVQTTLTLTGGDGIAAIGDLSANRTIDFDPNSLATITQSSLNFQADSLVLDDNGVPKRILLEDMGFNIVALSATTVVAATHLNKYLRCSHATGMNITVNSALGNEKGNWIVIEQAGAGQITVNGTATVNSPNGLLTKEQYSTIVLTYVVETATWTLSGDMST